MATFHREVYQPSFEDGPTYELEDEDVEDARARLPLLIVIALLVLAAFAGVVWLAYNQGIEQGRVGVPALVAAPEGPARTAPEQQAAGTPYTGLKVYGEPVSPDVEAATSTLARTPAPRPIIEEPAPAAAPLRSTQPAAPLASASPAPPPAAAARATPSAAAAPAARPAPVALAPAPLPNAAAAAPATTSPAEATAATSGGFVLQVGSYPSETLARNGWQTFRTRYGAIAGSLSSDVKSADLGAKGTWYRLRVGPFSDRDAASSTCDRLRAQGGTCIVSAP